MATDRVTSESAKWNMSLRPGAKLPIRTFLFTTVVSDGKQIVALERPSGKRAVTTAERTLGLLQGPDGLVGSFALNIIFEPIPSFEQVRSPSGEALDGIATYRRTEKEEGGILETTCLVDVKSGLLREIRQRDLDGHGKSTGERVIKLSEWTLNSKYPSSRFNLPQ